MKDYLDLLIVFTLYSLVVVGMVGGFFYIVS